MGDKDAVLKEIETHYNLENESFGQQMAKLQAEIQRKGELETKENEDKKAIKIKLEELESVLIDKKTELDGVVREKLSAISDLQVAQEEIGKYKNIQESVILENSYLKIFVQQYEGIDSQKFENRIY